MDAQGNPTPLDDQNVVLLVLAVLVKRLGPEPVRITQEDVDAVAFSSLQERGEMDGSLHLSVVARKMQG